MDSIGPRTSFIIQSYVSFTLSTKQILTDLLQVVLTAGCADVSGPVRAPRYGRGSDGTVRRQRRRGALPPRTGSVLYITHVICDNFYHVLHVQYIDHWGRRLNLNLPS